MFIKQVLALLQHSLRPLSRHSSCIFLWYPGKILLRGQVGGETLLTISLNSCTVWPRARLAADLMCLPQCLVASCILGSIPSVFNLSWKATQYVLTFVTIVSPTGLTSS